MLFVDGNRYPQGDGLGEIGVLDKIGGLAVALWGGETVKNIIKKWWNENKGGETKVLEREVACWVKKWVP